MTKFYELGNNVGECIECSIGIAPNRYLAKIASNMQKPNGLAVIRPEDIPERLLGLHLKVVPPYCSLE
jgi:DNA polymerase-4